MSKMIVNCGSTSRTLQTRGKWAFVPSVPIFETQFSQNQVTDGT